MSIKKLIKSLPFVRSFLRKAQNNRFPGSADYWEQRYANGGNSGSGSYKNLAEFKAEFLNAFVKKHGLDSVIELGSGDGNQLKLADYPKYTGLDISETAVKKCRELFKGDIAKQFYVNRKESLPAQTNLIADLALSLDVIFHLIEDEVFENYMNDLFSYSKKFVIIYSSNFIKGQTFHEKDRCFTSWVEKNKRNWRLIEHVKNKYPYHPERPESTSKADFYVYQLKEG